MASVASVASVASECGFEHSQESTEYEYLSYGKLRHPRISPPPPEPSKDPGSGVIDGCNRIALVVRKDVKAINHR